MTILRCLLVTSLLLPFGGVALAQDTPQGGETEGQDGPGARPGQDGQRPGRDRRQGRRGRGGGGFDMGRFKEELGLSDEQMEKFKALQDEMRQQMQDVRRQMREGTLDRDKMRETFEKARDGMQAKIDEILTPEQREKFKGMRENMRGRFGDRRRGPNREELGRRLREEAVKALALGEEEQAVVLPLLDTVLETRKLVMQEQARRRDAFLESVRSTTDAGALTQLLTDYRAAREADKAQVTQAQAQLREVLTVEQEAKLVGLNILD